MLPCFHQNLAHLRKLKRVNQREAAAALGVSQALLSHYEKGLREPGLEFLLHAAEYYGVSTDWLLGRTSDMTGTAPDLQAEEDALSAADPGLRAQARLRADKGRMQEAVGLLYDLLDRLDVRELEPSLHAHLTAEIVQVLSLIHLSAGRSSPGKVLFVIPRRYLRTGLEVWQADTERRMVANSLRKDKVARSDTPALSPETLEQYFGERGTRLLSAVRAAADEIAKYLEE